MQKIIFTCSSITPIAMNGAVKNIPELRATGIKAALRYWWRAILGADTTKGLSEAESKIFGSTDSRSKVIIRVNPIPDDEECCVNKNLLPHKNFDAGKQDMFACKVEFSVRINFNSEFISRDEMLNLFVLTSVLGGIGKRSRRGFGSYAVIKIDGEPFSTPNDIASISKCLEAIKPNAFEVKKIGEEELICLKNEYKVKFPYLKEVRISKSKVSLIKVGESTHEVNRNYNEKYKTSIGAGSPRFASPVYISVLEDGRAVVSLLNSVPPSSSSDPRIQNELIQKIVSA